MPYDPKTGAMMKYGYGVAKGGMTRKAKYSYDMKYQDSAYGPDSPSGGRTGMGNGAGSGDGHAMGHGRGTPTMRDDYSNHSYGQGGMKMRGKMNMGGHSMDSNRGKGKKGY